IKSVALHGLGGVGKTQVALAFAYSKIDLLDAIFWVAAETDVVLKQSFSRIAVNLELPNAHPQNHEENTLLVLSWLNKTKAKWLLIFDNVEDVRIFEDCWPVAKRGSVLVTTRHPTVAVQPIDIGIEIEPFSTEDGAGILEHLLQAHNDSEAERQARLDLSLRLNGHALAISQMAALINAKHMSVASFVPYYDKYTRKIHRERKAGWKYVGYNHALDTVWLLSFGALSQQARTCLSIFALLDPDRIPDKLFKPLDQADLPAILDCLRDEYDRLEVLEELTSHGLVKHDVKTEMFSLHRLVQAEFLYQLSENERQAGFDAATRLLQLVFPSRAKGQVLNKHWPVAQLYIQHVLALMNCYRKSQNEREKLQTTSSFCDLL
ncbi:P-loop containing nucleoside triphosphate hydrolase protein, partial [Lophiotrema nucula]